MEAQSGAPLQQRDALPPRSARPRAAWFACGSGGGSGGAGGSGGRKRQRRFGAVRAGNLRTDRLNSTLRLPLAVGSNAMKQRIFAIAALAAAIATVAVLVVLQTSTMSSDATGRAPAPADGRPIDRAGPSPGVAEAAVGSEAVSPDCLELLSLPEGSSRLMAEQKRLRIHRFLSEQADPLVREIAADIAGYRDPRFDEAALLGGLQRFLASLLDRQRSSQMRQVRAPHGAGSWWTRLRRAFARAPSRVPPRGLHALTV